MGRTLEERCLERKDRSEMGFELTPHDRGDSFGPWGGRTNFGIYATRLTQGFEILLLAASNAASWIACDSPARRFFSRVMLSS
jgi:hypothetical protein